MQLVTRIMTPPACSLTSELVTLRIRSGQMPTRVCQRSVLIGNTFTCNDVHKSKASEYCFVRHKCTYGNMAESELICVRAVLLRTEDASTLKSDVIRQYLLSELSRYLFY